MQHPAIVVFSSYYRCFEQALDQGDWESLKWCFTENATYQVENVPFACKLEGREAIIAGFRQSTQAFDAHMNSRSLDVLSAHRLAENRCQIELVTRYQRGDASMAALVTSEIEIQDSRIAALTDRYDRDFISGALHWLTEHAPDLDPSYTRSEA